MDFKEGLGLLNKFRRKKKGKYIYCDQLCDTLESK